MIKRIASIFIVFPAILIILAHAIIPHHHHHDRVCFNQHSCQVNQISPHEHTFHEMAGECYHCHHDGYPDESESSGCCMLAETIIFHPGPQRQELTCPTFNVKDHSRSHFIIPGLTMPSGRVFTPGNLPFRRKPFNTPIFLSIAVQTPGLRAPPSC